jgi:hypothetical protein
MTIRWLLLGGFEWLRTAVAPVQPRTALGQPWLRLAAIPRTVMLVTTGAAARLQSPQLGAPRRAPDGAGAMLHR